TRGELRQVLQAVAGQDLVHGRRDRFSAGRFGPSPPGLKPGATVADRARLGKVPLPRGGPRAAVGGSGGAGGGGYRGEIECHPVGTPPKRTLKLSAVRP